MHVSQSLFLQGGCIQQRSNGNDPLTEFANTSGRTARPGFAREEPSFDTQPEENQEAAPGRLLLQITNCTLSLASKGTAQPLLSAACEQLRAVLPPVDSMQPWEDQAFNKVIQIRVPLSVTLWPNNF